MKALLPTGQFDRPVALGDAPHPRPRPDEALIKVEAFSVNRGETFQLEHPAPGWRPGKDIAGLVVQQAADGSGPATGRRVVGHPPSAGWAEYAAVPTDALAELPDDLPTAQAAALPLAGLTALRLLRTAGSVLGRRLLLTGASGGVGHYLTELAAGAGAEVTAVTASPNAAGASPSWAPPGWSTTSRTRPARTTSSWSRPAVPRCRSRWPGWAAAPH